MTFFKYLEHLCKEGFFVKIILEIRYSTLVLQRNSRWAGFYFCGSTHSRSFSTFHFPPSVPLLSSSQLIRCPPSPRNLNSWQNQFSLSLSLNLKVGSRIKEEYRARLSQRTESMEYGEIEEESLEPHKSKESPYEMLCNNKNSVENIVTDMLSIKKDCKPKKLLRDLVLTLVFLGGRLKISQNAWAPQKPFFFTLVFCPFACVFSSRS